MEQAIMDNPQPWKTMLGTFGIIADNLARSSQNPSQALVPYTAIQQARPIDPEQITVLIRGLRAASSDEMKIFRTDNVIQHLAILQPQDWATLESLMLTTATGQPLPAAVDSQQLANLARQLSDLAPASLADQQLAITAPEAQEALEGVLPEAIITTLDLTKVVTPAQALAVAQYFPQLTSQMIQTGLSLVGAGVEASTNQTKIINLSNLNYAQNSLGLRKNLTINAQSATEIFMQCGKFSGLLHEATANQTGQLANLLKTLSNSSTNTTLPLAFSGNNSQQKIDFTQIMALAEQVFEAAANNENITVTQNQDGSINYQSGATTTTINQTTMNDLAPHYTQSLNNFNRAYPATPQPGMGTGLGLHGGRPFAPLSGALGISTRQTVFQTTTNANNYPQRLLIATAEKLLKRAAK